MPSPSLFLPRRFVFCFFAAVALCGCSGSVPTQRDDNEGSSELSAVLIRGRLTTPSGELRAGKLFLNLESDKQKYRLTVYAKQTTLYQVQPGRYHLAPTRTVLGSQEKNVRLEINGKQINLSFPEDMAEHDPIVLKTGRVVPIGIVDVRFSPSQDPNKASVTVSLDDTQETCTTMLQAMIQWIMGPEISDTEREPLMMWAQPMERALMESQGSQSR